MDQLVCVLWIIFLVCNVTGTCEANVGDDKGNPEDIFIERTTNETITVGWTSTGADQFKVIWSDSTGSDPQNDRYTIDSTITITGLLSGNLYLIFVKACDAERNCNPSAARVSTFTEPNKPKNISVNADKSHLLLVSWTPGDSRSDTIHTVVITSNKTEIDRHETQETAYFTDNMEANNMYMIEVYSSIKDALNVTSESIYSEVLTYPAPIQPKVTAHPSVVVFYFDMKTPTKYQELVLFDEVLNECTFKLHHVQRMDDPLPPTCDPGCEKIHPYHEKHNESHIVTHLIPSCRNYRVTYYAINEAGCSNASSMHFQTIPYGPVYTYVRVLNVTSNSVYLKFLLNYMFVNCTAFQHYEITAFIKYWDCSTNWLTFNSTIKGRNNDIKVVHDLSPYTYYLFEVPYSGGDSVFTGQDVPGKPKNITFDETNQNVAWDIIPKCEANGIIQHYALNYSCHEPDRPEVKKEEQELANITDSHLQVDFKPFRTCRVSVAGYTVGYGEAAEEMFNTSESVPGNFDVLVIGKTYTSILLQWEEPEERNGIIVYYTVIWNQLGSPEEHSHKVILNGLQYNITGLNPSTTYTVEVTASTVIGRGSSDPFTISTWTGLALPTTITDVIADESNILMMHISWVKTDTTGPTKYLVCVSEVGDTDECRFNNTVPADEQETEIEVQNAYWDHAVKVQTIVQLWDSGEAIATSETLFVKTGKTYPGKILDFVVDSKTVDCRLTSLQWTALDPHSHNGIFQSYTIVASKGSEIFETLSVSDENVTSAEIVLQGGKHYAINIFAVNHAYEGEASEIEYMSQTCAPIIQDSGSGIVQKSSTDVEDKQKTVAITIDGQLFADDSFGEVALYGLLIRDVTVIYKPAHKVSLAKLDFENLHQSTWINHYDEDVDSYRINLPENWVNSESMKSGYKEYVLGEDGKCAGFCNGYLKHNRDYKLQLFSCTSGGCLVTSDATITISTMTVASNPPIGIIAALAGVLGISLVVTAVLAHRNFKNHKAKAVSKEQNQQNDTEEDPTYDYIDEQTGTTRSAHMNRKSLDVVPMRGISSVENKNISPKSVQKICEDENSYYNVARDDHEENREVQPYEPLRKVKQASDSKHLDATASEEICKMKNDAQTEPEDDCNKY